MMSRWTSSSGVSGGTPAVTPKPATATASDAVATATKSAAAPESGTRLVRPSSAAAMRRSSDPACAAAGASGATLDPQSSALVTIKDVDVGGLLKFAPITYSVNEASVNGANPKVTLTVTRTGGAAGGVSVNFKTVDGTAKGSIDDTSQGDFRSVALGTLTFGGEMKTMKDGTVRVPVVKGTGSFKGAKGVLIIGEGSQKAPNTYVLRLPHPIAPPGSA